MAAAMVAVTVPAPAYAGDTLADLVKQVGTLRAAGDYAGAARAAARSAAREDLAADARVVLGGLARQNFELSHKAGGPVTELCGVAAVMRLVAPLDQPEAGAVKLAAAADAEARLAEAVGPAWRSACRAGGHATEEEPEAPPLLERPEPSPPTASTRVGPAREVPGPLSAPTAPVAVDRTTRRVRAGVGTLVPGALLFAPVAGVLAYRAEVNRDMAALREMTRGRPGTVEETNAALELDRRYMVATVAAAVLGTTGAALVVTGTVLLATSRQPRRVAVAPWGARGVGGLVLQGRF